MSPLVKLKAEFTAAFKPAELVGIRSRVCACVLGAAVSSSNHVSTRRYPLGGDPEAYVGKINLKNGGGDHVRRQSILIPQQLLRQHQQPSLVVSCGKNHIK